MTIPDPVVLRPEGIIPIAPDLLLLVPAAFFGLVVAGFYVERIQRVQYLAWACGLPVAGLALFLALATPEHFPPWSLFAALVGLLLFGLVGPYVWWGGIPNPPPAEKTPPWPPK